MNLCMWPICRWFGRSVGRPCLCRSALFNGVASKSGISPLLVHISQQRYRVHPAPMSTLESIEGSFEGELRGNSIGNGPQKMPLRQLIGKSVLLSRYPVKSADSATNNQQPWWQMKARVKPTSFTIWNEPADDDDDLQLNRTPK